MNYKRQFIDALHSRNRVRLTFNSKEDGRALTRECAPLDFAPGTRSSNKDDRFHFWDYDSDQGAHVLSLLPEQVVNLEVLATSFAPSEFVKWKPNWKVPRNWGRYS